MGTNVRIIRRTLQKAYPEGVRRNLRYLDLGAQQLYGGSEEDYLEFFRWAGTSGGLADDEGPADRRSRPRRWRNAALRIGLLRPNAPQRHEPFQPVAIEEIAIDLAQRSRADWETTGNGGPRASVAELFAPLGWEYQSIDLSGGTLALDLNHAVIPPPLADHFDVVANYGTSEHVFNQSNCFKLVHDATRIGGTMIHFLPTAGYLYHCLYKYDPKFFLLLCQANDYEMLHGGFGSDEGAERVDERHRSWANFEHISEYLFHSFIIEFAFRKSRPVPFAMPYDVVNTDLAIRHDFAQPCSSVR